jgi:hypothetical protein
MELINKLYMSGELFVIVILSLILLLHGTIIEVPPPLHLIVNYHSRIWQLIILLTVLFAFTWSPTVGILTAAIYLMYILDMETLLQPIKV